MEGCFFGNMGMIGEKHVEGYDLVMDQLLPVLEKAL